MSTFRTPAASSMDTSDSDVSREVYRDEDTAVFEWRIPDTCYLLRGTYSSPPMHFFDRIWHVMICTYDSTFDYVAMRREILSPWMPEPIQFTIRWMGSCGQEREIVRDKTFAQNSESWVMCVCPPISAPAHQGTLICAFRKSRDLSRTRAMSVLSDHFRNLLLTGEGHDVLFNVKDKEFRAHKAILKARSPVFAAMFDNNMAESAEGSVTIQDCDPDAFGDFLQFVYAGAVDITSVRRALGLYYVADKYNFESLKRMCVGFLKVSFTTSSVFDVALLASRHDEKDLFHQAVIYFARHLGEVLPTTEWRHFLTEHPELAKEMSTKAGQYLRTLNKN